MADGFGGYIKGQDGEATLRSMGGIKMGKKRVRRNPGLLYDKLVVMPGPATFPAYYQLVKRVVEEMREEFPSESSHDFGDGLYDDWFEKWFGSQLVKNSEEVV